MEKEKNITVKTEQQIAQDKGHLTMEAAEQEKVAEQEIVPDFRVNPEDYPIFSRQAGNREDFDKKVKSRTLSINETLGLMAGRTAETVAVLSGDVPGVPKADHVIYLDKSARPVSWLVNEFWEDFTNEDKPEETFLAIDRRPWFKNVGIETNEHQEICDNAGNWRMATERDFWEHFDALPEEKQKDFLARIRALYIEGGIEAEDVDTIMATPTVLDGKNLVIIDEVSRSGATLGIATGLLARAIGMEDKENGKTGLKSVNGHVFWSDLFKKSDGGETQMGNAPVWYPSDPNDWRGRGVKDINSEYYERRYQENPTNENRALKFGSIVIGEPLNLDEEPGGLSRKLKDEMKRMHVDYRRGKVLPTLPQKARSVKKKMMNFLISQGVEFVPADKVKGNPKAYINLVEERNRVE